MPRHYSGNGLLRDQMKATYFSHWKGFCVAAVEVLNTQAGRQSEALGRSAGAIILAWTALEAFSNERIIAISGQAVSRTQYEDFVGLKLHVRYRELVQRAGSSLDEVNSVVAAVETSQCNPQSRCTLSFRIRSASRRSSPSGSISPRSERPLRQPTRRSNGFLFESSSLVP